MGCGVLEFLDGGTLRNPVIVGGTATNTELVNPTITGGTANDTTLNNPTLNGNVALDQDAITRLAEILAPALSGQIALDNEAVEALLGQFFKTCSGANVAPGTKLMSCEEVAAAIEMAVTMSNSDRVTAVTFNPANRVLTISVLYENGTGRDWTVDLTQLMPQFAFGAAPAFVNDQTVPFKQFGGATAALGNPAAWMTVTVGGVPYRVPLYTPA